MASTNLFTFLSIFALLSLFTTASAVGFSVELIHHDHPKSPFYNPSLSLSDRVHATVRRSHARAETLRRSFFSQFFTGSSSAPSPADSPFPSPSDSPFTSPFPSPSPSSPNAPIETEIIANSFDYLMSLHLGTPSREVIAIADTGSDLIWVTCKPCSNCYKQDAPLFDPTTSSSYGNIQCSSNKCNQLPSSQCDSSSSSSECIYLYSYGDGSQTSGDLAQETVTFNTTSGTTVGFPNVAFGCSHVANGTFERHSAGLVGLGGGPLSLVSQLGTVIEHRFSYCLVPYEFTNVTTSRLSFGSAATISGPGLEITKMVDNNDKTNTFYTVTLDGITVGNNNNNTLGSIQSSNMIIDSGTTLTYLDATVLESLVETLEKIITLPQVEDSDGVFPLCFDESNAASDFVYPDITLQLGEASVTLKPYNAFLTTKENVRCLAMKANDDLSGLSILGNIAQQNFHVGFDMGSRKISFAPADCTKF